MSRIYQHTLELLPQIKEMLAKGKTHKEIEETLGLVGDRPVNNLLRRERRKEKMWLIQVERSKTYHRGFLCYLYKLVQFTFLSINPHIINIFTTHNQQYRFRYPTQMCRIFSQF